MSDAPEMTPIELDLTFALGEGYLLARIAGLWTAESMVRAIYRVAEEVRRLGYRRLVLDATGLSEPASDFHRYIAGEEAARAFDGIVVAVVYPAGEISRFGEETAFVKGADLRVVSDFATALRWLSTPDAEASE